MGILVLSVMILAEVGLGIYSITKQREKQKWLQNRCVVSAGELVSYFLMILLPGIDFSFRFKGLFFLLLIRALVSGICLLIKYRKAEGKKKIAGILGSAIVGILFIVFSLIPAFVFTGYEGKATSGEHEVAISQVILVDQSRVETFEDDGSKREVPVHFYYPADADGSETYPLVVFSHGAFGYYSSNTSTYMELASNGYVVMSLDHPYHSFFTQDTDGKTVLVNMNFLNEVSFINEEDASEDEIYTLSSKWIELRKADMNFALDTVKEATAVTALSDAWFLGKTDETTILNILNCINCDKIGLMGHSLGGATSVSLGREREDISAVIDLDGTMLGEEMGYENGEYIMNETPYPVPLLSIDNESHHLDGQEAGSYYVNNVVLQNALDGHNTYVIGSGHLNFTDLPLFAPILAAKLGVGPIDANHCIDTMNEIVLQYMNHYLKNEGGFNLQERYE
ncbi:MAG TPA: hypothetical protein VJY54_07195 [Lachnospiraceae bacterium]|nr:hypothetical protein [Lachnospiraceae bacterium]